MDKVIEEVMLSELEDFPRFREWIEEAIDNSITPVVFRTSKEISQISKNNSTICSPQKKISKRNKFGFLLTVNSHRK